MGKITRFFGTMLNLAAKQEINDRGFDDGLNGRPPHMWLNEPAQEVYDRAYKMGQEERRFRAQRNKALD